MITFTEFYVTLLGFVNYKLFSSLNLCYPPKVASTLSKEDAEMMAGDEESFVDQEYVAALSRPLVKTAVDVTDKDVKVDEFEESAQEEGMEELKSCVGLTFSQTFKLQKLFEGLVFFISREVPREQLVFVIRSFGGQVSWDRTSCIGSTYDEKDTRITHHIVDREQIANKYMNRAYIQPQWVFDCVNARVLLNVQDYFPGVPLPAHLSPFVEEAEGEYVAPEVTRLRQLQSGMPQDANNNDTEQVEEDSENEEKSSDEEEESEEEDEERRRGGRRARGRGAQQTKRKVEEVNVKKGKKRKQEKPTGDDELVDEVRPGKVVRENVTQQAEKTAAEEKRLAVMMIPKKKKRLYNKIMFGKKRQAREAATLATKRQEYERQERQKNQRNKASRKK